MLTLHQKGTERQRKGAGSASKEQNCGADRGSGTPKIPSSQPAKPPQQPQVERFLGGYSAKAAESAVRFALSDENSPKFKRARHQLATKLLDKPISQLVRSPLSLLCFSLCHPVQADGGWRAVCYGAPNSERGKRVEREEASFLAVRLRATHY